MSAAERIRALDVRIELSREALAEMKDLDGGRVGGLPGAVNKLRQTLLDGGRGSMDTRVQEQLGLVGRVCDLMTLQQSLYEKQSSEFRAGGKDASNGGAGNSESEARVEDLLARVRGQAQALNSRTVEMDELRTSFSSQLAQLRESHSREMQSVRQSSAQSRPEGGQGAPERDALNDQIRALKHENVVLRTRVARQEAEFGSRLGSEIGSRVGSEEAPLNATVEQHVAGLKAQHAQQLSAVERDYAEQLAGVRARQADAEAASQGGAGALRKMEEDLAEARTRERVALEQAAKVEQDMATQLRAAREQAAKVEQDMVTQLRAAREQAAKMEEDMATQLRAAHEQAAKVEEDMSTQLRAAREQAAALDAKAKASDALAAKFSGQVAQVTDERDRISADMMELRAMTAELESLKTNHEAQHKELIDARSKAANAGNRAEAMAKKLNEGEKERVELSGMLAVSQERIAELAPLEGRMDEAQEACAAAKRETLLVQGRLGEVQQRLTEAAQLLKEATTQLEESRAAAEHMKAIISRMRDELGGSKQTLEEERNVLEAKMAALKNQVAEQMAAKDWEQAAHVEKLSQELAMLREEDSSTKAELASRHETYTQEVAKLRAEEASTKADLASRHETYTQELAKLRAEDSSTKAELASRNETHTQDVARLRAELSALSSEKGEVETRLLKSEATSAKFKADSRELQEVVKELTQTLERSVEESHQREVVDQHTNSVIAKLRQSNESLRARLEMAEQEAQQLDHDKGILISEMAEKLSQGSDAKEAVNALSERVSAQALALRARQEELSARTAQLATAQDTLAVLDDERQALEQRSGDAENRLLVALAAINAKDVTIRHAEAAVAEVSEEVALLRAGKESASNAEDRLLQAQATIATLRGEVHALSEMLAAAAAPESAARSVPATPSTDAKASMSEEERAGLIEELAATNKELVAALEQVRADRDNLKEKLREGAVESDGSAAAEQLKQEAAHAELQEKVVTLERDLEQTQGEAQAVQVLLEQAKSDLAEARKQVEEASQQQKKAAGGAEQQAARLAEELRVKGGEAEELGKKLEVAEEMAARCKTVISVQQERLLEQESHSEEIEEQLRLLKADATILREHNTTLARAVKSSKESDLDAQERLEQAINRGLSIQAEKEEALAVASDAMQEGDRFRQRLAETQSNAVRNVIQHWRVESLAWAFGEWVTAREQSLAEAMMDEVKEGWGEEEEAWHKEVAYSHAPGNSSASSSALRQMGATPAGYRDATSGMSYMTTEEGTRSAWPAKASGPASLAPSNGPSALPPSSTGSSFSSDALLGHIGGSGYGASLLPERSIPMAS